MKCSICNFQLNDHLPYHGGYYYNSADDTICPDCRESGKALVALINNLENNPNSPQGLSIVLKWVKIRRQIEDEAKEKLSFLEGFGAAFRDKIHTDIEVKPGNNGPSLFAHRAILALRSVIFKNMLESDECKTAPIDSVTLPELTHEALHSLLEFLYTGSPPADKVDEHVHSLLLAAHKYEIPYLQKFCEQRLLRSLSSSTAVDILELLDSCYSETAKAAVINYIAGNMEAILFSSRYETFALKNPHLCLQIARSSFTEAKKRKTEF